MQRNGSAVTLDNETLLANASRERSAVIAWLVETARTFNGNLIAGIESWGYIWGTAVAVELDLAFAAIRRRTDLLSQGAFIVDYDMGGGDRRRLGVEKRAVPHGSRVILVDDTIVGGKTIGAAARAIELCGAAPVCGLSVVGPSRARRPKDGLATIPLQSCWSPPSD